MNQGETMGGTVEDLPTWDNGVFSKILREAAAAVAQHTLDAAALWASVFDNATLWLDLGCVERYTRPCEYEAVAKIFWQCKSSAGVWDEWKRDRLADLIGEPLPVKVVVPKPVQLPLPFVAAA
jgi:hypothetical protein